MRVKSILPYILIALLFVSSKLDVSLSGLYSCRRVHLSTEQARLSYQWASLIAKGDKLARTALQYGVTAGDLSLRENVARFLNVFCGIKADVGNIGISHNFYELLNLIGLVFLDPGDLVYVLGGEIDLSPWQAHYGAQVRNFTDIETLASAMAKNGDGVKILYLNQPLENSEKEFLLELADDYNFIVVEDGRQLNGAIPLKTYDKTGRVIFVGDFGRILTPLEQKLIPFVYFEAPNLIMEKLVIAKGKETLHTNSTLQVFLNVIIQERLKLKEVDPQQVKEVDLFMIGEEDLNRLFSEVGKKLKPSRIRQILEYKNKRKAGEPIIYLAGGMPDESLFPFSQVAQIIQGFSPEEWERILEPPPVGGIEELRGAISKWLKGKGIAIGSQNIRVTNGSQQVLSLLGRWAKRSGRMVITENPTYLGALTAILPHIGEENLIHLDFKGLLKTQEGIEEVKRIIEKCIAETGEAPIIYLTPNFGNPTGYLWSEEERQAILDIVKEFWDRGYDVVIIEDDPYGELNYTGRDFTRLAEMDDIGAIIYVGTFSKTLFPGMRTGYFATRNEKYLAELTKIMEELRIQVPTLTQFIIAKFVSSGEMDRHVEQTLIPAYSKKAEAMRGALQEFIVDKYEGVSFTGGDGGLFVWLEVPPDWGIDLDYLLDNLAVEGVEVDGREVIFAYVPGASFTKDGSSKNGVRLCFSTESIERMKKAIQAFARILEEYKN